LKRRNVKNYSETNWIGGREAKAASTQSFSCRRIKHLFLQWLTLKRVKVWKDYRKSSSTGSICCRTFCKAIRRFSLEKKGGWIPDSPAIISTPFTPHCRWNDAAYHQWRAPGQCNLIFLSKQRGENRTSPHPIHTLLPSPAFVPALHRYA
jgi:hypothetical protein